MAVDFEVEGIVKSIGALQNIQYTDKATGQAKAFTKFELGVQVGDEEHTYETAGFNLNKLVVGSKYLFGLEDKSPYNHNVRAIEFLVAGEGVTPTPPKAAPVAEPIQAPAHAPVAQAKAPLKTDFGARFREYNTHQRTAQMQATERVGFYVKLALEGKLVNDEGQKPDALTIGTIQSWISQEIDKYWEEYEVRVPRDVFGDWED